MPYDLEANLEKHLASISDRDVPPEVTDASSSTAYSWKKRIAHGTLAQGFHRIYLDQRYWIFCRDASLGVPAKPVHAFIWSALSKLVDDRKVICPASYPVLFETLKQGDPAKRTATAAVVDKLSGGYVLQNPRYLIEAELYDFFHTYSQGKHPRPPLDHLAWTFSSWMINEVHPISKQLGPSTDLQLRKAFLEFISTLPFSILVETLHEGGMPMRDSETFAKSINEAVEAHKHEVTSFETVFMSEVGGILDACKPSLASVLGAYFVTENVTVPPADDSPEMKEGIRLMGNAIYNLYRFGKLKSELPFLYIAAGLHGATRHRGQPFKAGDHWDFSHAHAALRYCNAFFTERSLGNLLTTNPLNYATQFGCRVLWEEDAVLEYLRTLG